MPPPYTPKDEVEKKLGTGGWKKEAQTSGWLNQPGEFLNLLTFSARTPTLLQNLKLEHE